MDDTTKMLLEQLNEHSSCTLEEWSDASQQSSKSLEETGDSNDQRAFEESRRLKQQLERLEMRISEVEAMVLRHLNTPDNIAHRW